MKILQVIHDFLPHHAAGSELYAFYLSRELAKRHSVYVMYTEVDHTKEQYYYRRSTYLGLPVYEVIYNHVHRTFEDTYSDPRMNRVFSRILDEVRPDVIHLQHLLHHSIQYVATAKKRGIPVVFTLHDYWLTCPNGGQRIRPDLQVCENIELQHCADCIRRMGMGPGSYLATRVGSRLLGLKKSMGKRSLLGLLSKATVDTPRSQFVGAGRFTIGDDARNVLRAHPPSRVVFPVKLSGRARLQFGVAMHPGTYSQPGEGVTFEVRAAGRSLWSRSIHPQQRPEERCWLEAEVALPAPRNGVLEVELLTRANSPDSHDFCTAGWSGLRLLDAPGEAPAALGRAKSLYRAVERMLVPDGDARLQAKAERRLERVLRACQDVDLFIAPSSFLAEKMIEFGLPGKRMVVSDNGMRTDLVLPFRRKRSTAVRFGYVGTLVAHKGLHVLLDAFRRLRSGARANRAELKIFGNPRWFPDYVKQLQAMITADGVQFLGEFENTEVQEVFAELDVLVVPSLWWENSPITIHEAILTETPVIAANFGGMAEFVKDEENGLLYRVGDAEDLARQMARVVEDPSLLDRLRTPVVPIKTIEEDAATMERRYLELVEARSESSSTQMAAQ